MGIDGGSRGLTAERPEALGDIRKVDIECEQPAVKLQGSLLVAKRFIRQPDVVVDAHALLLDLTGGVEPTLEGSKRGLFGSFCCRNVWPSIS